MNAGFVRWISENPAAPGGAAQRVMGQQATMNTTKDRQRNQLNGVLLRWAERSVPLQESLRRMDELVGPVNDRTCLWVVAEDALVGYQIMQRGGRWSHLGILERPGMVTESLLDNTLDRLTDGRLPYPADTFDVLMLDHVLEFFVDVAGFVSECHRVLKPNGFLVVQTQQAKRLSLVAGLHLGAAFLMLVFFIAHVYMSLFTAKPMGAYLKAMITGYEDVTE